MDILNKLNIALDVASQLYISRRNPNEGTSSLARRDPEFKTLLESIAEYQQKLNYSDEKIEEMFNASFRTVNTRNKDIS